MPQESFSSLGAVVGGSAGGGLATSRIQEQRSVLARRTPVQSSTRLGAFLGTSHYAPRTVGSGAHANIGAIHTLFGNFGEGNIGRYFNQPSIRPLLSAPAGSIRSSFSGRPSPNLSLGAGEHGLWVNQLFNRPSVIDGVRHEPGVGIGSRVGGLFGSIVTPTPRAVLQAVGAASPRTPQALAFATVVAASMGVGNLVGSNVPRVRRSE